MNIAEQVKKLLLIVEDLNRLYPKKEFTLDGRLLGDLGEVLVEQNYDLVLNSGVTKHHDATTPTGQKVQIKTTMKDSLTYPADHTPDFYLGIKIRPDGSFEEIFNGPGKPIGEILSNRQTPKTNLHNVSLSALKDLNNSVPTEQKIKRR